MASVSIRHLGKDVPATGARPLARILGDISIEVAHGELLVLVGPSGCGKTTLLRCIAGLETPTRGDLLLDGERVNDLAPGARDIAMVFQSYALYPHFSVRENLAFGLKMRKTPRDEIGRRVDEAAAMLDIAPYLDRKPAQLSGGQRQRVAMGRAVVRRPRVFLFDEPLSNLDASLRGQMRVELKRLHARLGATMIYVTHDQVEAMTLADRIAILRGGALEQIGAPRELYERPANLFVARFIGTPEMNTHAGQVKSGEFTGGGLTLPALSLPDGAASVGIRPEDLRLAPAGEGDLQATVEVIENLGADSLVHLDGDGVALCARVESSLAPAAGSRVGVTLRRDRLHFFGADDQRIGAATDAQAVSAATSPSPT